MENRMKHLLTVLLATLLLLPFQARANTEIIVFPAELSVSFEAVAGRVVLAGNQVLYWSDSATFPSFYFDRAMVERSTIAGGVLSVELKEAIQIKDGSRSRFDLRLVGEADLAAIERWFSQTAPALSTAVSGASGMSATSPAPALGALGFDAEHTRTFGGNRNGKLVFSQQGVAWECLDDATQSRTWEYKAIKRLDRKNPYEVVVDTFRDGKYTFKMTLKPMGNEDYSTITDYLAAARSASRQ
jgi:hypothetical protein